MSTNTNQQNEEIDLGQLFKKIFSFLNRLIDSFFNTFFFLKKNYIIVLILLIAGGVLGYYLDKKSKTYNNEVIVAPNFVSIDYLYSKVKLLQAKNKEKDTLFLADLGFKNIKDLGEIKIEPIIDIYSFIENKQGNFDLIKLMAEGGSIDKIVKGELTKKSFPLHTISFTSSKKINEENTIKPLIEYLNDSDYFSTIRDQFIENEESIIRSNDSIINQIDILLKKFSKEEDKKKNEKLVYYNENNQLGELLGTKERLMKDKAYRKTNMLSKDEIVKVESSSINLLVTSGLNGKRFFIFPLLFIFLFLVINKGKQLYKKQQKRYNSLQ